jgi:hypothetical protein
VLLENLDDIFARYRLLESCIDIDWPSDHGSLFHPLIFEPLRL